MAWTETEYRVNHIDEYGDISDLDHYDTEAAAMAAYEAGPHWHEVEKETRYYRDRDHSSEDYRVYSLVASKLKED
jgi:hypothetical protein